MFVHIAVNACDGINGDLDVYFLNCNESIMQKTIQGQGHRSQCLYILLRNREYSDAENTEGLYNYIVGHACESIKAFCRHEYVFWNFKENMIM